MAALLYNDKEYPLIEQIIIGRQKSCDVALLDQGASRQHCKVFRDSKLRIWVEDLGSANGTKVNGEKIKAPTKLKDGDIIVCSKSSVTVKFTDEDRDLNRSSHDIFNPEALVNKLISGHRIQSVIGSTNIVTVYIAKQLSLDRDVVLKVVHPDFADSESPLAKEIDEQTKLAARINHQSIAQVHECGTEQNFIWSSMEFIDGEMLFDLLDREGQLTPDIALMMTEKIADGLASAHEQGIVHRALNPRNIMLSKDGRIKVVDLVLEQFLRYHLEQKGIPTPEDHADYLAPELLRSKKGDAKSDIYSLGCILFQMLSGQPPYVYDNASKTAQAHIKEPIPQITEFCPDLPSSLQECISTMLHKNPEWRHQSMSDLREDLEKIRKELPQDISQNKARKIDRPRVSSQRLPAAKGSGTGVLLNLIIIAAIAGGIWYALTQLDKETKPNNTQKTPQNHSTANDDPNVITPGSDLDTMRKDTEVKEREKQEAAQNKALNDLWQRSKTKAQQAINDGEWDAAEYQLQRDMSNFTNSRRLTTTAQNFLKQVRIDGRNWYNDELNKCNSGNSIADLRERCTQLSSLRSQVINELRADVDARLQEAITGMQRHLAKAKQAAISQVEQGQLKALAQSTTDLGKEFAGTPVEAMHRQFAALVNEAQRIPVASDWDSTRQQLLQAQDAEMVLAAGAALILSGNREDGTRLLLQNDLFNTPDLRKRRDRLVRSQAAIIDFSDSSDLQSLTFITGQPAYSDGFISGDTSKLYELRSNHVLGNKQWEIACTVQFPQGMNSDSEFLIQIGNEEELPVVLSLSQKAILRVETDSAEKEIPSDFNARAHSIVRCIYADGTMSVYLNNTLIDASPLTIPDDTSLNLSSSACNWKLHRLMVLGSE